MGFFDRIGDIGKGFADVGLGIGKFSIDTVMSGRDILTGDVDEGFERLLASVQEDLLGQTLQGAFGPEGIIGSVVGALPEGIRKPGRAVVGPAFEAWNWATEELVDRPLGTIATLINLSLTGRPDLLFDGSAWARAWDINDKRTLGQSVTAAIHFIDPFDDEAYNKLAQDPFFNVMSGFIDFSQEIFLDPIERGLRGVKNLSTGKTVVAVAKEGRLIEKGMDLNDVYMVGRKKVSKNGRLGYQLQPDRVYTPGGGLPFRKEKVRVGENGEQLIGLRTALGRSINYARVDSVMETAWWERASKAMDQPNLSFAERLDALETATGKRFLGAKQATEAFTLIANGPTAKARELTARVLLGDDRVFDEAIALADELQAELIPDEDGFSWVDKLKEAIDKKEKLAEIGIEISERAKQGDDAARLAEVRREQELAETEVEFGLSRELVDEEGNVPELSGSTEAIDAEMGVREETGIQLISANIGDPSTARDISFGPPDKPEGGYFEFDTPTEVVNSNRMIADNMIEFTRGSETNPGHAFIKIKGKGKIEIIGMNVQNNIVVAQSVGGYTAYQIVQSPSTGKLEWQTSSQVVSSVLGGNLETAINTFTKDLPNGWIWGSEPTAANIAEYKKAVTEKQRKAQMVSDEVNASSLAEEALEFDQVGLNNLLDESMQGGTGREVVIDEIRELLDDLAVKYGGSYAPADFTTQQRRSLNQQIELEILRKLDLESKGLTVNDFFSDEVLKKLDEQMFGKVNVDVPPLKDVFPTKYVSRQQIHQALVNDAAKKGRLYPMLKTDASSSIAQIQDLLSILMLSLPEYMAGRLLPQTSRKPRYQSETGLGEKAPYIKTTRTKLKEYGLMPDVQYEDLLNALIAKHKDFFQYKVAIFESVTGSSIDTLWTNFTKELSSQIPGKDTGDLWGATVEETLEIIEQKLKTVDELEGQTYKYNNPVAVNYENLEDSFFAINEFFTKYLPKQYKKFPEKLAEITDADLKKVVQEEMQATAKSDQLTFLDKDFYSTARLIIDNPENLSPPQIALQIVKRFTTFTKSDLEKQVRTVKEPQVIKVTKLFVDDHLSRDLPMPEIVKKTKTHYFIKADFSNKGFVDLFEDAKFYADGDDFDKGLRASARALAKKIDKVSKETVEESDLKPKPPKKELESYELPGSGPDSKPVRKLKKPKERPTIKLDIAELEKMPDSSIERFGWDKGKYKLPGYRENDLVKMTDEYLEIEIDFENYKFQRLYIQLEEMARLAPDSSIAKEFNRINKLSKPIPTKPKARVVKFSDILGGPEPGVVYTAKKLKDGGHGVTAKGAKTPLIKLRKSGGIPERRIEISFRDPKISMQENGFALSKISSRTGNIILERVPVKGSPKPKYRIAGFTSYQRVRKIDFKPEELQLIGFQLDDYAKLYDSPNAVYEDIVEQNFGIARATSSAKKKKTDFEGVGAKRQAPGINEMTGQLALIRHHVQKLVDKINKEEIEVPAQLEIVTEQLDEFDAAVAGVEPTQELVNFNALADLSDEGLDAEVVKLTQEVEQLSAELTPTLEKVNAVDWESLFDIEMAKRSNMQRNKGLFGGEVPNTPTLEELFMDDPGNVALLSTVFDIIVARNELGGNLNDLDMFAGKRLGFLDTYYGAPFFARAGTVAAKLEKAESDAKPNPMPIVEGLVKKDEPMSGLDVMEALGQVELTEYYNRSITSPLGIRAFRIFNQRLPHSMISWNHNS